MAVDTALFRTYSSKSPLLVRILKCVSVPPISLQENSEGNLPDASDAVPTTNFRRGHSMPAPGSSPPKLVLPFELQQPVTVTATNLDSPKAVCAQQNQGSTSSTASPLLSPSMSEMMRDLGVDGSILEQQAAVADRVTFGTLNFHYVTPQNANAASGFDHATDNRFELRQMANGAPAWVFTTARSTNIWLEQCRAGLSTANGTFAVANTTNYVPVIDVFCPVVELLILRSCVLGGMIVRGAHRWMTVLQKRADLMDEAVRCECMRYMTDYHEDSTVVKAFISFTNAPPVLTILFLACVWVEARAAERCKSDKKVKYPIIELATWVKEAVRSKAWSIEDIHWAVGMANNAFY